MVVAQAFRYELDPTVRQRRLLGKAVGTARYAFNSGLAWCKRLLDASGPVPRAAELHRLWNAEKPRRSWVYGVSKCCGQEALCDIDGAFANFWRWREEGRRLGFPRFRRKHGRRDCAGGCTARGAIARGDGRPVAGGRERPPAQGAAPGPRARAARWVTLALAAGLTLARAATLPAAAWAAAALPRPSASLASGRVVSAMPQASSSTAAPATAPAALASAAVASRTAAPGPGLSAAALLSAQASKASPAAPWSVADRFLYLYHHYADFTPAQCAFLPRTYVQGCLYGAERQDIAQHRPDPVAERERLFQAYRRGAGFSYSGCLLLQTDTVEGCQERFPRRPFAALSPSATALAGRRCFTLSGTRRCGTASDRPAAALPGAARFAHWCATGFARSPLCGGTASAQGHGSPSGHVWVWLATGDLYLCRAPADGATALAGCSFSWNTAAGTGWGLGQAFPAAALARAAAPACPAPLSGPLTHAGSPLPLTLLGPRGSVALRAAIRPSGGATFAARALQRLGYLPVPGPGGLGVSPGSSGLYLLSAPLVLDQGRWVPLGRGVLRAVGISGPVPGGAGAAIGPAGLAGVRLQVARGRWSLTWPCA